MVTAHVIPLQNDTFMIAFIFPEENPKTKRLYTPSPSQFDIDRRLGFVRKQYVQEKLCKWLHQRAHARKDSIVLINNLDYGLSQFKNRPFVETFQYVARKRQEFESIAPSSDSSRCFAYYRDIILKVLNFCTEYREEK